MALPHQHDLFAAGYTSARERRAAVLRYPDLAARLRERPLALTDPHTWNGFIPPQRGAVQACVHCEHGRARRWATCDRHAHGQPGNHSAVRTQLLEIEAEAWRRDEAARQAHDLDQPTDR